MTSPPTAENVNLIDLPWVLVIDRHGQERVVSLRDVFLHADDLAGFSPSLAPVETEALLRFLTSIAALILRKTDGETVTDPDAVNAIFTSVADRFNLLDPDIPFLQEWHVPPGSVLATDKAILPMARLDLHYPGGSSQQWGLRERLRPVYTPTIPIYLVAKWMHGKPGNGAVPGIYAGKQIAGAPSGGPADTSFHLFGPTLADSFLLNLPRQWLETVDLPAWLDQDVNPPADELADGSWPLWRATWTPNRPLILHDRGKFTGWVIGLTNRPIPSLGSTAANPVAAGKENAKLVNPSNRDYAHATVRTTRRDGTDTVTTVLAPENLASTEGFLDWYRKGFDAALRDFGADRVERGATQTGFHNERGDSYGSRSVSEWMTLPLGLLTVPKALERENILTFARDCATALGRPLKIATAGKATRDPAPIHGQARRYLYASFDQIVLPAFDELARSETPNTAFVMAEIAQAAIEAFTAITAPFLTPATTAQVMQARAEYRQAVTRYRSKLRPDMPTPISAIPTAESATEGAP